MCVCVHACMNVYVHVTEKRTKDAAQLGHVDGKRCACIRGGEYCRSLCGELP